MFPLYFNTAYAVGLPTQRLMLQNVVLKVTLIDQNGNCKRNYDFLIALSKRN